MPLGVQQDHDVYKQRLSASGSPVREAERHDVKSTKKAEVKVVGNTTCGACYGAEDAENACCNTCDEVSFGGWWLPVGSSAVRLGVCASLGSHDLPATWCCACQVRAAYRRRGWALTNVENIEQCKHDAYIESIREQKGEGCRMWGHVEVNKVR